MRRDIRAYLWDINEKLGRFFMNPQAFRTELGRADALISGSFALQFFARRSWPESDLDVYLRDGDGVDHLGQYLVEVEGYDLVPDQRLTLDKDIGTYGADHVSRVLLISHLVDLF
jgi:hypothetical protein